MVSARARSEWKRLRGKNISSIWSPASQEFSAVGNAGVGVVSLKGAPLAWPTFATPGFERFFWFRQGYSLYWCLWGVGGLCILLSCMVSKVLILLCRAVAVDQSVV